MVTPLMSSLNQGFIRKVFSSDIAQYKMESQYEPVHHKTNKLVCVPSQDSDQPDHPPSLISLPTVSLKEAWALNYLLSTMKTIIRPGKCPGWSESSLGAQVILLILSCSGSLFSWLLCHALGQPIWGFGRNSLPKTTNFSPIWTIQVLILSMYTEIQNRTLSEFSPCLTAKIGRKVTGKTNNEKEKCLEFSLLIVIRATR